MEMFFIKSDLHIYLNDYRDYSLLEKCIAYIPLFIFFSLIHQHIHLYLPVFRKKDYDFFISFFSEESKIKIIFHNNDLNNQNNIQSNFNSLSISLNDDIENVYERLNVPYNSIRLLHSHFNRNQNKENLLYLSFHQQIFKQPYVFTTFLPSSLSEDYYMYNPYYDIYKGLVDHSFNGYWREWKGEMYELGKVIEEAEEIWVDARDLLWLEIMMKLKMEKVKRRLIYYGNEMEKMNIKKRFSNSVLWIFILKNSL